MKLSKLIAFAVAIAALVIIPIFLNNDYYIHLGTTILIYIILLCGLDIVVGYTGQVSLGHAGLFGVGAYTTGVLFFKLGMPFYITVPASIMVTAFFGGLLALPALKVIGPYLAMVTLAFGTILQILINEMSFLTEGPMGIKLLKPSIFGNPLLIMKNYNFFFHGDSKIVAALGPYFYSYYFSYFAASGIYKYKKPSLAVITKPDGG